MEGLTTSHSNRNVIELNVEGGYAPFFITKIMDNKFRFLYWDDLGDSQSHVDNQKKSGGSKKIKQSELDLLSDRIFDAEWAEKEQELNSRMDVIGQNGNNGEHYEDTEEDVN